MGTASVDNEKQQQPKQKRRHLPEGIRERSGKWHYYFETNGNQYSASTGLDATPRNLNAAVAKREEARKLVAQGQAHLLQLSVQPFNRAAEKFLAWCDGEFKEHPGSAERIRSSFASLVVFFEKTPCPSITPGDIEDYKSWRRDEHEVREITIRHDLHALSKFFGYCKRHNWAHRNPLDEVAIPSGKEAVRMNVQSPEAEKIYFGEILSRIAAAKHSRSREGLQTLYDLGRLMLQQGCRPEEFCEMEWATGVDLEAGTIRIVSGKTAAARRTLRLTHESREILARRYRANEQRGLRKSRLVFPSQDRDDMPVHRHSYSDTHNRILDRVQEKYPDFRRFVVYDWRHTFGTRMGTEQNCPLPVLAALLGHANLSCVAKYCHPQRNHCDDAMERYSQAQQQAAIIQQPITDETEGRVM